jgi:hypothetical protein
MHKTVALIRAFTQTVPLLRRFVVAIGIGLTLASLHPLKLSLRPFGVHFTPSFDILKVSPGANYSSNLAPRLLLIALIAVCTALLIANVLQESDRFLASISGIGAILLGYFLLVPVAVGFGHLGDLALAPKLGLGGSALIVLGAAPLRTLGSFKRSRERSGLLVYATWLLGATGLGLVIVSLWHDVAVIKVSPTGLGGRPPRYWDSVGFSGGHTLGVFMLALAIFGIAMALGAAILKTPLFGRWALVASLLLLGITLYYPTGFAFHRLITLSSGGGLAFEGSLLASAAALIAVAVERGAVDLKALTLPRLVAIAGMGLVLAGTWTNIWGVRGSLWIDGTLAGLPSILIVLSALLVAASFAYRSRWFLLSVTVIGWLLVGYFGYYVAQTASNLGTLGPALWLGAGGGALMGLSAVSLGSLSAWRRRSPSMTLRRFVPWLATGIGTGLVLGSLWLDTERAVPDSDGQLTHISYWSFAGEHALGIAMLVIGASVLVALVGAAVTRLRVLSAWTLAASLALFGLALFLPTFEAFNHLDALRSGAWLALVGSLLASVGAVYTTILDLPPEDAPQAETGRATQVQVPLKGKQRRVPGTRRA